MDDGNFVLLRPEVLEGRYIEITSSRNDEDGRARRYALILEGGNLVVWVVNANDSVSKIMEIPEIDTGGRMEKIPCPIRGLAVINCGSEILLNKDEAAGREGAWLCTLQEMPRELSFKIDRAKRAKEHAAVVVARAEVFNRWIVMPLARVIDASFAILKHLRKN